MALPPPPKSTAPVVDLFDPLHKAYIAAVHDQQHASKRVLQQEELLIEVRDLKTAAAKDLNYTNGVCQKFRRLRDQRSKLLTDVAQLKKLLLARVRQAPSTKQPKETNH